MDPSEAIRASLHLEPVPGLDTIAIYQAHAGSGLSRLLGPHGGAPYWAYPWAGGLALARHFAAHPELVAGRRVLDLGAGSGLVGIAAARAGALASAAEIDPLGRAAIALNAAANGVRLPLVEVEIAGASAPTVDLIAAGDVFYAADVARLMLPFLELCAAAGIAVLVGDPGRRDLPVDRLDRIASYAVADVGDARGSAERVGSVYVLKPEGALES
jgi:predicted nicotinamide N-methyase